MRLAAIFFALALFGCLGQGPARENETPGPTPGNATPPPPAIPRPSEIASYKNLQFAYEGRPLLLDLYVPKSANPVPLAILIHGGGWAAGSKEECPGGPEAVEALTSEGVAVACIDYRLSTEAKFPAQMEDVKTAIRWLRSNSAEYGLDSGRFGAWGISAGAHLAALAGTSGDEFRGEPENVSSELQAVVDWYGPTDFMGSIGMGPPPNITERNRTAAEIEQEVIINEEWAATYLIGGPLAQNVEKVRQANPIAYVTPDDPPFLIFHGTADGTVPVNQSRALYAALREAGVEATYVEVEGAGHGFPGRGEQFNHTIRFLADTLKEGLEAGMNVTVGKDLAYSNQSAAQKLDLYIPKSSRPLSTIIYIHGGGWRAGTKDGCLARGATAYGFAVACIDYRLSGEAIFPAQIEDVKAATAWLRAHSDEYGLDPGRFGAWGDSAGGHLAALLGTSGENESRVQAVADWFGPVDFTEVENRSTENQPFREYYGAAGALLGGPIRENHALAAEANPITYITPGDPPFLIIHGTADGTVPVDQSRELAAALEDAGVGVTYIEVEGGGHGFQPEQPYFTKTMEFFAEKLE